MHCQRISKALSTRSKCITTLFSLSPVFPNRVTIAHFVLKTHVKEVLTPAKIGKLFDLDFNEAVRDDKGLSHLDIGS